MKYLTLMACLVLTGCCDVPVSEIVKEVKTVEIEGCEYLILKHSLPGSSNYAVALTHKGNCRNPIHMYNPVPLNQNPEATK